MTITLPTGTDKLDLILPTLLAELDLSGTEVTKNRQVSLLTHHPFQFFSHRDAATHDHHVDIIGGALEENVTDIAAHHITVEPQTTCGLADQVEDLLIEYLC